MNICRICETIDNLFCSLNDPENSTIVEMLTNLANVSYSNDDQLPKFMCEKCKKNLQLAIEFKRQCEMTDRKLRRLSLKLEDTKVVKYFASIDEEFQNFERGNYDTDAIKVEYLEEGLLNVGINVKEEDIFFLHESTELVDTTDGTSSKHSGAVKVQKQKPAVSVGKKKCNLSFESGLKIHKTKKYKLLKRKQQKEDRSESHHDPILTCFYCNKLCFSNQHYERHVLKEHCSSEKRTFQCFDCKKEFKSRKIFRVHYVDSHSGNSNGCRLCSKQFLNRSSLSRHLKIIHYGVRKYKCNICEQSFGQKNVLDQHIATHSEDRSFRCEACDFTTKTALLLRNHTANKHTIGPKKPRTQASHKVITTCEYCGKQMPMMNYFNHIRNHTGVKPYKCEICPKSFLTNVALREHTYVHTGEYPYNCNVCDRKFRGKHHLKYHTLTHTGEKPHQCTFCNRMFAIRGSLKAHIRQHTGEKPYQCTECYSRFIDLNALKRHTKKDHTK